MLIFNPAYRLVNDLDRILLLGTANGKYNGSQRYYIHPDIAEFLARFDGKTDNRIILSESGLSAETFDKLISIFSNKDILGVKYQSNTFVFPPNVLTETSHSSYRTDLNIDFSCKHPYDFKRLRLSIPKVMVFIINMSCYTDCIYCYANKKYPYTPVSTSRILELIREAKRIGIMSLTATGGEFFLHPDWKTILKEMLANGFAPEISTKVPLDKSTLQEARALGLESIQFSLDTLNPDIACQTLNVRSDYINKIISSIRYADELFLKITLKPTLCRITCNRGNLSSILEFAESLRNIEKVTVSTMGCSMYINEDTNREIMPSVNQVKDIIDFILTSRYNIQVSPDGNLTVSEDLRNKVQFKERAICSANLDGILILPDGKVTICEELYWHDSFLIGDLTEQSIMDVWNSGKAIRLWNLSQKDMPDYTACRTCEDIHRCRQGQGVCWKMVLQAYGMDREFMPDPRCPKAPAPYNDYFLNRQ